MNRWDLAAHIARVIMDSPVGVEPDRAQRLAFRGGRYPDAETDLGGLNQTALVARIKAALDSASDSASATQEK